MVLGSCMSLDGVGHLRYQYDWHIAAGFEL